MSESETTFVDDAPEKGEREREMIARIVLRTQSRQTFACLM